MLHGEYVMTNLETLMRDSMSRRQFLARMTAAGLGAAATAMLAGCGGGDNSGPGSPGTFPGIPGSGDIQVLNYALALETTEADLYRQALNLASSKPIDTPLSTAGPGAYGSTYPGGQPGTLSSTLANIGYLYLAQYAYVEAAHRDFLLVQLGHSADTPGQLTTTNATNPVLDKNGYKFPTASSKLSDILTLLRVVEETGVTAYLGAVPYISSLAYAQAAASIYSTEARHSAGLNYVLGLDAGPSGVAGGKQPKAGAVNEFEYAQTPTAVLHTVTTTFYK